MSVNFKNDKDSAVKNKVEPGAGATGRKPVKLPPNAKPSVIIDILDEEGPYRVIEPPVELLTIAESDNEEEKGVGGSPSPPDSGFPLNAGKSPDGNEDQGGDAVDSRPRTPPPETTAETLMLLPTPSKGPMTPPEEPPLEHSNSYDPFEPTDSPEQEDESTANSGGVGGELFSSPPLAPVTPPLQPETPPMLSPPLAAAAPLPPPPLLLLPQRPPSPPVATVIPFLSSASPQNGLKTPEPLEKISYIRYNQESDKYPF